MATNQTNQTNNQFVFTTEVIEQIKNKSDAGYKVARHEKFWYSNLDLVKRENIVFDRTDDEVEEYMKCVLGINDIKYVTIDTPDGKSTMIDGTLHTDPNKEPEMTGVQYFSEKYCQIKREDGSIGKMKLRDYQKDILDLYDKNRFSLLIASRQIGKCFLINELCDVYDEKTNTYYKVEMFKIWFKTKKNKNIFDYLKYGLYLLVNLIK